jgi:hypothetical protein
MSSGIKKQGGGEYTIEEALRERKFGTKEQQDALIDGKSAIYAGMKPDQLAGVDPKTLAANLSPELLGKSMGAGGNVADALLRSGNPEVQAAIRERLSAGADPNMRKSLLGHMGVGADGAIDKGKMTGALGANIALLPDIMSNLSAESKSGIDEALRDPGVMKAAISAIKKDPAANAALRGQIGGLLGADTDEGKDFAAQMASMDVRLKRTAAISSIGSNVGGIVKQSVGRKIDIASEKVQSVSDSIGNTRAAQTVKGVASTVTGAVSSGARSVASGTTSLVSDIADRTSNIVNNAVEKGGAALTEGLERAAERTEFSRDLSEEANRQRQTMAAAERAQRQADEADMRALKDEVRVADEAQKVEDAKNKAAAQAAAEEQRIQDKLDKIAPKT